MGRFADGLYGSDSALDYLSTITDKFEKELYSLFSPGEIPSQSRWLVQVLSIIEMMLILLEIEPMASSSHIRDVKEIKRWRDEFFSIWDSEWNDNDADDTPLTDLAYRQQHRPALVAIFDRLESIAHLWEWVSVSNNKPRPELAPLNADYPLPYFSVTRLKYDDGSEFFRVERFISDLLEWLVKEIIYWLSPEKRAEMITFYFRKEVVWVAVDILGFLCEKYKQSPEIEEKFIRKWRETTVDIWKQHEDGELDKSDSLYQEVMSVFERMEAVARQYPTYEW